MPAVETIQTQIPETHLETLQQDPAGFSLRDRLFNTGPGRALAAFVAAASLGGAVELATAASAEAQINLGSGIGAVSLGQTKHQVRRELGKPSGVDDVSLITWTYDRGPLGPGDVTFNSKGRVALIGTANPRQRTNLGIGVGSTIGQLEAAYPSASCHTGRRGPADFTCDVWVTNSRGHLIDNKFRRAARTSRIISLVEVDTATLNS